jgi:hypothetical protein
VLSLPPAFSELDQLLQDLRDKLEKQGIESIDDVVELIFKMFEREKDPST